MGSRGPSHGQSADTLSKEAFFGLCLGHHMKREAQMLAAQRDPAPYFHLDLNAGSGHNGETSRPVVGTPILFMRQAKKHGRLPIRALFVEKNHDAHQQLSRRLLKERETPDMFGLERSFEPVRGTNGDVLASFPDAVAKMVPPVQARGSIISDPNGWSPKAGAMDLAVAANVARALPRFMFLIFFLFGRAKAVRGYVENGEPGPIKNVTVRSVRDHLGLRPFWLISEPIGQRVYLCGSASRFPDGLEHVPAVQSDSRRGREILRHCDEMHGEESEVA